ncbi:MAG: hypothetical protein Kow0062_15740 [Acidobacteriota bacterium]
MRHAALFLVVAGACLAGPAAHGQDRPAAAPVALVWEATVHGSDGARLTAPVGVAALDGERIAVADADPPRLVLFRRGAAGWSPARVVRLPATPAGIAAVAGRYAVSVRGTGAIYLVDPQDGAQRRLPLPRGTFAGPLAGTRDGRLAVVDLAQGRLLVVTPDGAEAGELPLPPLARDVADTGDGWLVAVPPRGQLVPVTRDGAIGEPVELPGVSPRPCWPAAVAVAPDGARLVLDRSGGRILLLDENADVVGDAGGRGWRDGRLMLPSDLALAGPSRVVVADQGNARVQVFRRTDGAAGR